MIDTLRVRFPISNLKEEKFLQIAYSKSGNINYRVWSDRIDVPSSDSSINVYINNNNQCTIEFSLPKYIYGNNIELAFFSDFEKVFSEIEKTVLDFCLCPAWKDWELIRLDMCKYLKSNNPYEDILLYQTLEYPRQDKYIYNTSVMFKGRSYSTKFYIKYDEFKKNDYKKYKKFGVTGDLYNKGRLLLSRSENKIRVELTSRGSHLVRILSCSPIYLSNIVYNKSNQLKLKQEFKSIQIKLNSNITKVAKVNNKRSKELEKLKLENYHILSVLESCYSSSKALRLYQFWVMYYENKSTKNLLLALYSKSTISRNLSDIAKAIASL